MPDWAFHLERERARYTDGTARLEPGDERQLVRLGNAAYGAGLASLMAGAADAPLWFARAAARWRASWELAPPDAWGRPVGAVKAALLAGDEAAVEELARWSLEHGAATADSPIGRYAGSLALLALGRWAEARHVAQTLRARDDFPPRVADALTTIAAEDVVGAIEAIEDVVESFETRTDHLEDVPVADTALVLAVLAKRRGIAVELPASPVLPSRL